MRKGHLRRVQHSVVRSICGFVTQQIAVRPRVIHGLIALPAAFADRERDRAVRVRCTDGCNQIRHPLVRPPGVFPALQHKGSVAKPVSLPAAEENLLLRQAVARLRAVGFADAAVIAVVFADIGELDDAAEIHPIAEALRGNGPRQLRRVSPVIFVPVGKQRGPLRVGELFFRVQSVDPLPVFHLTSISFPAPLKQQGRRIRDRIRRSCCGQIRIVSFTLINISASEDAFWLNSIVRLWKKLPSP